MLRIASQHFFAPDLTFIALVRTALLTSLRASWTIVADTLFLAPRKDDGTIRRRATMTLGGSRIPNLMDLPISVASGSCNASQKTMTVQVIVMHR